MIGQRYAGAVRPATRSRRNAARQSTVRRPASAGTEQIAEALGQSPVVRLALFMSLVVFAAYMYMNQATRASVVEYNIGNQRQSADSLRQQNVKLHAVNSALSAPGRIRAAAAQLGMTRPDVSATIWIQVMTPQVRVVRPVDADIRVAQQESSPAAWLQHAYTFAKSSL